MVKSTIILLFLLAFQLVSSTSFFNITNDSKLSNRRFNIKLIHHDSLESPLYLSNLSELQRTKNLILQSKARSEHLFGVSNNSLKMGTKGLEAEALVARLVQGHNSVYMAQIAIGTFRAVSSIPYFLHIETAYSLTWVQCEGCRSPGHHCFPRQQPIFPDSNSRTYQKLLCDRHSLCFPGQCLNHWCSYHAHYANSSFQGYLASDTFVFQSGEPPRLIPGIVFGCGFDHFNINCGGHAAGLMGLGFGRRSILSQLGDRANLRFSYCLVRAYSPAPTKLRFGVDVPSVQGLSFIDLVQVDELELYFVNLIGLSLATEQLFIPPFLFARKENQPLSGTVIDMGAMYSSIVRPAYLILKVAVINHLMHTIPGIVRMQVAGTFELCFRRPGPAEGFAGLPSLTFHFVGDINMVVPPEGVFHLQVDIICLAAVSSNNQHFSPGTTLIGATQQVNHRFIFNVAQNRLYFGPENCVVNG